MKFAKNITIFEGPDGSGKTTAAKAFAEASGSEYIHLGPFPRVKRSLARLYAEAMMPAVRGDHSIVLDRSWLSEVPYGIVYREGFDRLGVIQARMLERLAWRCHAQVVICRPPWSTVLDNYERRKGLEMLDNHHQVLDVWDIYGKVRTSLNTHHWDYTSDKWENLFNSLLDAFNATSRYSADSHAAGNILAPNLIIGESFSKVKEHDPLYQWPFASFTKEGCSWWLTEQLHAAGIHEQELMWINADDPMFERFLKALRDSGHDTKIFALGRAAGDTASLITTCYTLEHPQYWKRFRSNKPYPLVEMIREN